MKQTEGNIYLADKRHVFQTEIFRSFSTIHVENPFASIIKFSDNTLVGGKSCQLQSDGSYSVIFLPLVGAIDVDGKIINSGEVAYWFVQENEALTIENPYEEELVNYLEIWIKTDKNEPVFKGFDLENHKNTLVDISGKTTKTNLFIGKFDGRNEDVLHLNEAKQAFIFIINGAFEVQNRLLESRDAVSLWNCDEIDFEALSNEAIILLMTFE